MMADCIFCKIAEGKILCSKIYEDAKYVSFLDISPANKGHALVLPKKHIETFSDATPEVLADLIIIAHKIAKGIVRATRCDGYNILINDGTASGQVVMHLHLHIIPKHNTDSWKLTWPHIKYADGEMQNLLELIKNCM